MGQQIETAMGAHLLERVRLHCRQIAAQASLVSIRTEAIPPYAASIPKEELTLPKMDPAIHYLGHGPDTVAFMLTLDSINFGSGYFPDILGDTRRSGFRATASALNRRFREQGPLTAQALAALDRDLCLEIFGGDFARPAAAELVDLFCRALNELGRFVEGRFHGDFAAVVVAAAGSAERLLEILTEMPLFRDAATWHGAEVPFLKRAQLTVADLFIAFGGEGAGRFHDIRRLTACADNLLPHVLRMDGVLRYEAGLLARIEAGELIAAGSREEVEIRACTVHAAELIVEELRIKDEAANAMMLDNFLWHRGQEPAYRARPRHRTRTVFY
jgi:hypothetical protein